MPSKQVIRFNAFEGGLNSAADPRDITSTQLVDATDIMVDSIGRIVPMGAFINHEAQSATGERDLVVDMPTPGHGLFSFRSDYEVLTEGTGGSAGNILANIVESPTKYIAAFHSVDDDAEVALFQKESGDVKNWLSDGNEFDLGGTHTGAELSYYINEGALRVCANIDATNNKIKWIGPITPKQYGEADDPPFYGGVLRTHSTDNTTKLYEMYDSELKGAFVTDTNGDGDTTCLNAVMATGFAPFNGAAGVSFGDGLTLMGPDHDNAVTSFTESDMTWGFHLGYGEGPNDDGTWNPPTGGNESDVVYKFWISTMYDNHTQESLPQLLTHYSTSQLGSTETSTTWGTFSGETGKSKVQFSNMSSANSTSGTFTVIGQNVPVWFLPRFKLNCQIDTATTASGKDDIYVFGASTVGATTLAASNKRISGCRVYWSSSEDGHGDLWEIFDCDFHRGVKTFGQGEGGGSSSWAPWSEMRTLTGVLSDDTMDVTDTDATVTHAGAQTIVAGYYVSGKYVKPGTTVASITGADEFELSAAATGTEANITLHFSKNSEYQYISPNFSSVNKWLHPPKYISYFTNNGHEHNDTIHLNSFKTAVVANKRVYVGNINQTIDDVTTQFSDRMLKSPVNQFDKFPSKNFVDVSINDGSQIIHLATFADKILQFKEDVMYIINIAEDSEYLESTHKFKGVTTGASVCTTDHGIAWANGDGAYLFDGDKVHDILEQGGQQLISLADWQAFAFTPLVGYIPDKRQVVFVDDVGTAGDGSVYIFDVTTRSWVKGSAGTLPNAIKSNFINDYDNNLVFYDYTNKVMYKWSNTAAITSGLGITLKDMDFDAPGVKKRVFKVYVSYKGDGSAVTVKYGTNGTTPAKLFDSTVLTNAGTTDWEVAELAPGTKSEANNIYSFQLAFGGTAAADFEINDISIIYRMKRVK